MTTNFANQRDRVLREIASRHLGLDTLETRNSDGLDFHEVSVWQLRAALEAAYSAGMKEVLP